MDSFTRKQLIIQMIPRQPRRITTAEILTKLADEHDIRVDRRTINRDIGAIRAAFPLDISGGNIPGYYWPAGADTELVPGHDDYSALTWNLLEDYLAPLVPRSMRTQTQPAFDTARRYLEQSSRQKIREWRRRVRVIPRAFDLKTPEVDESVQVAIYEALWDQERLKVEYASRSGGAVKQFSLHPQGMVIRDGIGYLLAVVDGYDDIRHFALHRFGKAEIEYRPATMIEDFDLDAYIEQGGFAYVVEERVDLHLAISQGVAHHLRETPLADNQALSELDDGRVELRASVADTLQLRWWLMGFGSAVEVLAPMSLREFMTTEALAMAERYRA